MRRLLCLALCFTLLTTFIGCGSQRMAGLSDRAYELGLAALETADEYIDGSITASRALSKLEQAKDFIDGCDGENDILISSAIFNLIYTIQRKDSGIGTMKAVEEKRDSLANLLGE